MNGRTILADQTDVDLCEAAVLFPGDLQERLHGVALQVAAAHQLLPPEQHVEALGEAGDQMGRVEDVFEDDDAPAGLEQRVQVGDAGALVGHAAQHAHAGDLVKQLQFLSRRGSLRRRRRRRGVDQPGLQQLRHDRVQVRRAAEHMILASQARARRRLAQLVVHADARLDAVDGRDVLRVREPVHLFARPRADVEDHPLALRQQRRERGRHVGRAHGAELLPERREHFFLVAREVAEWEERVAEECADEVFFGSLIFLFLSFFSFSFWKLLLLSSSFVFLRRGFLSPEDIHGSRASSLIPQTKGVGKLTGNTDSHKRQWEQQIHHILDQERSHDDISVSLCFLSRSLSAWGFDI